MTVSTWRGIAAGVITAAALLLGACGTGPGAAGTARATAGDVTVTVTLKPGTGRGRELVVTFRPQRPGFHIYSAGLPAGGADGMGIPTRIAVRGGLMATGRPAANQPVLLLHVTGIKTALPVYPDGPVTFIVPVRVTGASGQAEVVVSYGACSDTECMMPVTNEAVPIKIS